jgi:hypothetical protein
MEAKKMIDYLKPAATAEEEILRRIKGNYRRQFVSRAMQDEGVESVPAAWKNHDISKALKGWLGQQNPSFRGGEDLPDVEDGEVEIARLTFANSVHGEVTSLRAKQANEDGKVFLADGSTRKMLKCSASSAILLFAERNSGSNALRIRAKFTRI